MFNGYKVITITHNVSGGDAHFYSEKATEKQAIDSFYENCATYGTNPATEYCEVIVINVNGEIARMEKIDNNKYQ